MNVVEIIAIVLSVWTAMLVWWSWHLLQVSAELKEHTDSLKRWSQFRTLSERQRAKWQ